ncbi:MAG: cupin domain-containing protein [Ferruginibacter sp.]
MKAKKDHRQTIILAADEGRVYKLGAMTAIFKADLEETDDQYSISEWWLDPHSSGPHAHQHEDQDQVFYVLEGTISMFIDDQWIEASKGTFIRIARNTMHSFANRTDEKAGMLNFDIPGGFEKNLPSMVKWFEENE